MNAAIACLEDTILRLVEEAKQASEMAIACSGASSEAVAFNISRSETLTQVLHTWSNQLQTFGLESQMNGVWADLRDFLRSQGY